MPKGQKMPTQAWLDAYLQSTQQAVQNGQPIQAPPAKYSGFLFGLKKNLRNFNNSVQSANSLIAPEGPWPLSRVGDDQVGLTTHGQQDLFPTRIGPRHHYARASYFSANQIPAEHMDRINQTPPNKPAQVVLNEKEVRRWATQFQSHIFKVFKVGLESLIALCSYECLDAIGEDGLRDLLTAVYLSAPEAHALAMWGKIADSVNISGIYRNAQGQELAYRQQLRDSMEYRFVEGAMLAWQYMINVRPGLVNQEKRRAYEEWKIVCEDADYQNIMQGLSGVDDVPVDLYQRSITTLFDY